MSARVLILGATSAVAGEVARLFAARGARLHLVGRDRARLARLATELGPGEISWATADFLEPGACAAAIAGAIEALGTIDVALVAHGYLGDQARSERDPDEAALILRTNLLSVVELLVPLAQHLEGRGAGRLGVITSVAGDRGRPRNYTYGAAKGGLNVYLQGLRSRLHPAGVTVTTIKLGPVDTPMTVDHTKNLLFSKAPDVAREIVAALDAGEAEVYVPGWWRLVMGVVRNVPEGVFQRIKGLSGR